MAQQQQPQTKVEELLHRVREDNEFTSIRVSKNTLNELAKRGQFRDTFETIIQKLLVNSDDKLQPTEGSF